MKDIDISLLGPLSAAINKSLSTGIVPDSMKVAKVVMVIKQGDNANLTLSTSVY